MSDGNQKKAEALGMSFGTASNRLRKLILFSLVRAAELDVCYQCDGKILNVDDLSIEHKEPWLQAENPVEAFFDLNNIAFSHLSCNIGAAGKPMKRWTTEAERRMSHAEGEKRRWASLQPEVQRKIRHEKYLRNGC